jgi:hypothetical protein
MNLAFLPCRNEANLTIIQIMQQERSFLRREFGFTSKKHNARRAYNLVPLAVKTSRPHFFKNQKSNTKFNFIIYLQN